mgnify:CR=1 FL=1
MRSFQIVIRENLIGNLVESLFKPAGTFFLLFLFLFFFFTFFLLAFPFATFFLFLLALCFGGTGGGFLFFQGFVVAKHIDGFRWSNGGSGRCRLHLLQAAVFVAGSKQAEQCILHAVFLQYIAEAMDGVVYKPGGLYLIDLAAFAECVFHVFQVGAPTGEDDAGQQSVFVSGKLQLVPYIGKDFFGTGVDDVVQHVQLDATTVLQCADCRCFSLFFLVKHISVFQLQLLGFGLFHLQGGNVTGDIVSTQRPGQKLPSENELTREYALSRHTVRKALALLENEGYITARHGKGTFCSERVIQRHNSKNIAVTTTYLSDYIFPRLIQGMDRVLSENGYSIILKNTCNSRSKEEKVLKELLDKPIDGLIIEPSKSQILCRHINLYEMLDKYQIPYVFIQGCYPQMADKPCILMDDCKGGYLLTRHLLETGRRNIIGIFKADDSQGAQRHKGYVQALQESGILYDPENVIWFHTEDRKTKPSLMLSMLLDSKKSVDAAVCYNDQIALAVISMLEEKGISVPEDIAVTGYDNSLIGQSSPIGITTIAHPQEKLGEMAAELILEKIRKVPEEESSVKRLISPELIVRESTAGKNLSTETKK